MAERRSIERQYTRDRRALFAFAMGAAFLFVFFAAGAFVGRSSRSGEPQTAPQASAPAASPAMLRVEVATVDTRERAEEIVSALRRKYTSAKAEREASSSRFRVFVGPYPAPDAAAVAAEIRELGYEAVQLHPFDR